jgi:hypothetical protein
MYHLGKFEDTIESAGTSNDNVRGPAKHTSSKMVDQGRPSQSQILSKDSTSSREKDSDEEDMIGPPLPPTLAKGPTADDDDVIGPPLPPGMSTAKDSDEEDEEEAEEVGIMSMHYLKGDQISQYL